MVITQNQKSKIALLAAGAASILTACGGDMGNGSASAAPGSGIAGENTDGVTVSNVYSSPKELGVGDLLYVDLNENADLSFDGVDAGAEFSFVVANTSSSGGNFTVQMHGNLTESEFGLAKSSSPPEEEWDDLYYEEGLQDTLNDFTASFHDAIRFRESDLEYRELPLDIAGSGFLSKSVGSLVSPSVAAGNQRSFKVLASLNSSKSYVNVDATAECVGSNVVFYIDDRVTADMLSTADVNKLCTQFDNDAAKEYGLFGNISDVNGDGRVVVLLTPQINKLGAQGGGIITGFFTANDLYAGSNSNPASNHMEILYIMVPDPSGQYGLAISNAFAMNNLLPPVLVHELQHAINYNEHVFQNGGTPEQSWLNEGLSHLAEDLLGHNQENPSRYVLYLQSPHSYPLVTSGSPGLANRGAAYLYLRFLYEQHDNPNRFLNGMIQTRNIGVANVEVAFGGAQKDFDQFGEFFLRWSIALVLTNQGVSADRNFTYRPRVKSPYGTWTGVCTVCNADDGRGTVLTGVPMRNYNSSAYVSTSNNTSRFYSMKSMEDLMQFKRLGSTGEGFGVLIRTK